MQAIAKRQSLPTSFYKTYKKPLLPSQEGDRVKTSKSSATTGCAVFLMASTGAAVAQTESAPIEEVIVTGIRKSIEDSIAVKKNDDQIVEVVTAEDIGKLPDSSIAESLARLPGLAAQRTNGRAQTLSIRGLGPDFTVTTFNGREQASTNDNRTVEFDQYPSELVTQVKIYKTPDAGMAYQGIAGTTDISTVHPLAYNGRQTAATYRHEYNEQDANIPGLDRTGDRANLTYIDQFRDGTWAWRWEPHTTSPRIRRKPASRGVTRTSAATWSSAGTRTACSPPSMSARPTSACSSFNRTIGCTCWSMATTPISRNCRRSSASSSARSGQARRSPIPALS
jgi:hypothetical protein